MFEWVVSAKQAHSIDECEQIVLRTNQDALRDAFAHHLSSVSQQHALEIAGSLLPIIELNGGHSLIPIAQRLTRSTELTELIETLEELFRAT